LPITILRVARGGRSNRIASVEGGGGERVVRPSPSLVFTGNWTGGDDAVAALPVAEGHDADGR